MTTQDFINKLKSVLLELNGTREQSAAIISLDVLALLKSRIINVGKDHTGKKIGDYSTKEVPTYWYVGKEKRIGNAVERLKKVKGDTASYKDWRDVNNLPTAFKNFSFTGHMWSSIQPKIVARDQSSITIAFVANTENGSKKIQYALIKYPNLLTLNKTEEGLIIKSQENRLENVFKKHGLL